jgi:hypothetical protein
MKFAKFFMLICLSVLFFSQVTLANNLNQDAQETIADMCGENIFHKSFELEVLLNRWRNNISGQFLKIKKIDPKFGEYEMVKSQGRLEQFVDSLKSDLLVLCQANKAVEEKFKSFKYE